MTQLPRPIGMPARLAVYSASSRPCAAATWLASAAKTAAKTAAETAADAAAMTQTAAVARRFAVLATMPLRQIEHGATFLRPTADGRLKGGHMDGRRFR